MSTIIVISPSHSCCAELAIAASRAGGVGVLHLGFGPPQLGQSDQLEQWENLQSCGGKRWGIRWDRLNGTAADLLKIAKQFSSLPPVIVLHGFDVSEFSPDLFPPEIEILCEVCSIEEAIEWDPLVNGLILSGNEAGGRVGLDSSFILLQKAAKATLKSPYYARGGMGPDTTAAACLSGAAGVVLEEQLWLSKECSFAPALRKLWNGLDGSETECVGQGAIQYRIFSRTGTQQIEIAKKAIVNHEDWLGEFQSLLADQKEVFSQQIICLGQDVSLAAGLAREHGSTARILSAFQNRIRQNCQNACQQQSLNPNSAFAKRNGAELPIFQGPMTRVSDVAQFAVDVQNQGAVPFLALSLMKGPQVDSLLDEAKPKLAGGSWGVGILGFVPHRLREEQIQILLQHQPTHAIIAGGRPGQALELESHGISTFLHVPSPRLLKSFFDQGCRKFIFEGRECGGHVGPRSSLMIWQTAVSYFLNSQNRDLSDLELVFAGGIHDSLSAAMVSVIAAPLVARGAKIAVLMGTSYLFTHEAVSSGAIQDEFQNQAVRCRETALLDSGSGHQTRAALSPFIDQFENAKRKLLQSGRKPGEIRHELEMLNIGRLRIASKGVERVVKKTAQNDGGASDLVSVSKSKQIDEGLYMIGDVATMTDSIRPMQELHDAVTKDVQATLSNFSAGDVKANVKNESPAGEPLAVVGMGCIFPGATSIKDYWENIVEKKDWLGEIPSARWDIKQFYDEDRFKQDRVYAQIGSFIDEVIFDPTKYGIPPVSLRSIEPIQLLALEVAEQALSGAGYHFSNFPKERTSVIFAAAGLHDLGISYAFRTGIRQHLASCASLDAAARQKVLAELEERLPGWTEDSFAGFLLNVVAGRIANRFNLQGSNFTVDAACASSLAAVQVGVEQLRNHSCDAVLVGAVDGTNNPFTYMSFAKTQALSPGGRSNSLDKQADGIGLGEGVGAIVLKRLSDAELAGDEIQAVLCGVGSSSDGRNRSMTAPYAKGQITALHRAYQDAGVSPNSVSLLELHSTGTKVGDEVEIQALTTLFTEDQAAVGGCAVGSIKSMIGHTKTAAGMASLIKVILSLKQRIIPPTLGVDQPLDLVSNKESPFYVASETQPWILTPQKEKRRAGVSCFGFGGTNFHAVLEEYSNSRVDSDLSPRDVEILCWSRSSLEEVRTALNGLRDSLAESNSEVSLNQLAYSHCIDEHGRTLVRSENARCRLALVAGSLDELRKQIECFLEQGLIGIAFEHPSGIYYSEAAPVQQDQICFVFPGQGSQKPNMLRPLLTRHNEFNWVYDYANRQLAKKLKGALSRFIFPNPVFSADCRTNQAASLDETRHAQPALAATELFALELLASYGIHAQRFAGHSFGEYTALYAAGVFTAEEFLNIAVTRGEACWKAQSICPGSMAAVFADPSIVSQLLRQNAIQASIANYNSQQQVVIAGENSAVESAIVEFKKRGIRAALIPVTAAFHTPAMTAARTALAKQFELIDFKEPVHKVYSNTTAQSFPNSPMAIKSLLVRQLTEPVRFQEQIQNMDSDGVRVFVEVGPGKILSGLINQILGEQASVFSLDCVDDQVSNFARTLGQLFVEGVPVDVSNWFRGRALSELSVREYLQQTRAESKRKPTDWLVNSWRARPYKDRQDPELDEQDPIVPAGSQAEMSQTPNSPQPGVSANGQLKTGIQMNSKPRTTKMKSVADLVKKTSQSRLELQMSLESARNSKRGDDQMTHHEQPDSHLVRSNPGQPLSADALNQFQSSMQQWLDLQSENQKAQARFLEIQADLLAAIQGADATSGTSDGLLTDKQIKTGKHQNQSLLPNQEKLDVDFRPGTLGNQATDRHSGNGVLNSGSAEVDSESTFDESGLSFNDLGGAATCPDSANPDSANRDQADRQRVNRDHQNGQVIQNLDESPDISLERSGLSGSNGAYSTSTEPVSRGKPSTAQFRTDLLTAISERTGYPIDMLDEDLDLEGGLGIDSIKMVEIFSSLHEYHDYLPGADNQEDRLANFANQKSIQDIIRFYESMIRQADEASGTGVDPSASQNSAAGPVERMVLTSEEAPLDSKKKSFPGTNGF